MKTIFEYIPGIDWRRHIQKLSKSKIYLKPQEKPPKGARIQRGPRGGTYYETSTQIITKPISDKKPKIHSAVTTIKEATKRIFDKTLKDNNEHAYLSNDKMLFFDGDGFSVGGEEDVSILRKFPNVSFKFGHTHPIDMPLSNNDVAFFLRFKNLTEMTAITKTRIFKITKTPKTSHFESDKEAIKFANEMESFADEYCAELNEETPEENWEDNLEESLVFVIDQYADMYHFKYEELKR